LHIGEDKFYAKCEVEKFRGPEKTKKYLSEPLLLIVLKLPLILFDVRSSSAAGGAGPGVVASPPVMNIDHLCKRVVIELGIEDSIGDGAALISPLSTSTRSRISTSILIGISTMKVLPHPSPSE